MSGVTLAVPGKDTGIYSDGRTRSKTQTMYSWTGWVLLAALVIVGVLLAGLHRPDDPEGKRALPPPTL